MRAKRYLEVLALVVLIGTAATLGVLEHRASEYAGTPGATAPAPSSTLPVWVPDAHAIAVVGDSLGVQAGGPELRELEAAGWRTVLLDAQMGRRINVESFRPPTSGISAVRAIRAAHRDPLTWVIELGTNDVPMIGDDARALERPIDAMLDAIGPGHRIVWVNVHHGPHLAAAATFNRVLAEIARQGAGMVVADWASRAWHDGYLLRDGVHLTDMGTNAYASMIADAAKRAEQLAPAEA
jgi:hypothetical protein